MTWPRPGVHPLIPVPLSLCLSMASQLPHPTFSPHCLSAPPPSMSNPVFLFSCSAASLSFCPSSPPSSSYPSAPFTPPPTWPPRPSPCFVSMFYPSYPAPPLSAPDAVVRAAGFIPPLPPLLLLFLLRLLPSSSFFFFFFFFFSLSFFFSRSFFFFFIPLLLPFFFFFFSFFCSSSSSSTYRIPSFGRRTRWHHAGYMLTHRPLRARRSQVQLLGRRRSRPGQHSDAVCSTATQHRLPSPFSFFFSFSPFFSISPFSLPSSFSLLPSHPARSSIPPSTHAPCGAPISIAC